MNTKHIHIEVFVGIVAVLLLILLANPFMFWMPSTLLMVILTAITALVVVWVGFVLTEKMGDEREELQRIAAGRTAYVSAAAMLTIALAYQGITHTIDFWIPATLAVMIFSKLVSRMFSSREG